MNNNKILAVLSTSAFSAIVVTAIDDEKITTMQEYDGELSRSSKSLKQISSSM